MDNVIMIYKDGIDGTIQTRKGVSVEEVGSFTVLTDRNGIKHKIPTKNVARIEEQGDDDGKTG